MPGYPKPASKNIIISKTASKNSNNNIMDDLKLLPVQKAQMVLGSVDVRTPEGFQKFEEDFKARFKANFGEIGLDCGLFRVGWYNDLRKEVANGTQLLSVAPSSLGVVVTTSTKYFSVIEKYCNHLKEKNIDPKDPIDSATKQVIAELGARFSECGLKSTKGYNTDHKVEGKFVHVQSLGYISGMTDFIGEEDCDFSADEKEQCVEAAKSKRDPALWGDTIENVVTVSLHKTLGGWFAFRMLFVIPDITIAKCVAMPMRINVLPPDICKKAIAEFNVNCNAGKWRDIVPGFYLNPICKIRKIDINDVRYPIWWWHYFTETDGDVRVEILDSILDGSYDVPADHALDARFQELMKEDGGSADVLLQSLFTSDSLNINIC